MLLKTHQLQARRFFSSEAGMALIEDLRVNTPGVSRGDSYAMVFDAGKAEGYKDAINRISEITPVEAKPDSQLENPGLNP